MGEPAGHEGSLLVLLPTPAGRFMRRTVQTLNGASRNNGERACTRLFQHGHAKAIQPQLGAGLPAGQQIGPPRRHRDTLGLVRVIDNED